MTTGQQQFASRLAADTGLDPSVVSAWLLAEENGSAASSRQAANNNDWLNIGYTDSGTYGSSDSIWSDPTAAADATAGWLKGQNTIPGYGTGERRDPGDPQHRRPGSSGSDRRHPALGLGVQRLPEPAGPVRVTRGLASR